MVSKNKRVKPDYQLFDLVIKACTGAYHVAASDAFRAESVMRQMWSLHSSGLFSARPQSNTYKHVIIGYKKAGVPQRAEDLLWEMESKSVGKPDKHIFQTVLNAWHASRHPDKQKHLNSLRLSMKYRFDRQADSFGEGLKKS